MSAATGGTGIESGVPPSWEERIAAFWSDPDSTQSEATLARMRALVDDRPADDPAALFELASVHDYLGEEAEAIPLYRSALAGDLDDERRAQAVIQLASSLRNVGDAPGAVELLTAPGTVPGPASAAFLALALHDLGRGDEALKVALSALAVTDPMYGRAISRYVDEL